jgi:hypothetical protein
LVTAENASDGGVLAEHLALLDFAVTETELDQIVPVLGRVRIARTLSTLRPILDDAGTQGGLRIHHESFRRFMVENLIAEGRGLGPLLEPVISWLDARGLFKDQRAFRHLLPLLRRAGRAQELLDRVRPEFVSSSVAELQPEAAIDANLRLAADVAAERGDFAALARVAELRSASITTFDEKLHDPTVWAESVAELQSPQRLAERLLYDGRPTWPRATGLRLCAVVERAGAAPPWREYLAARSAPDGNVSKSREQEQRETLDEIRGMLRTFEREDAVGRLAAWLEDYTEIERAYVEGIAVELGDTLGPSGIAETLTAAPNASPLARATLELGLAEVYASGGEAGAAADAGRRALAAGLDAAMFRRLLDVGLPVAELTVPAPDLSRSGLLSDKSPDADQVEMFLSWVLVAAARGEDLSDVRAALEGEGFYPAWLRFCCDVAEASHCRADVIRALDELAAYDEPFAGSPRASDLYSIWALTEESFRRVIALVGDDEWSRAVDLLLTIAGNTTTFLQNHPGGPLTLWTLLELLQPHADRLPLDPIREAVSRSYRSQFYELHAEVSLRMALFEHRAGQSGHGEEALATAGQYLAAYGFHKDVTVFGLVEALEAVTDDEHQAEVTARFRRLFPLCQRAYRHSDGKETRHATSVCFGAFAKHSPGAAADALARTFFEDPPVRYRDSERGLIAVTRKAPDAIPPLLRHSLWRCCSPADVTAWLDTVEALAVDDQDRAREALTELAAAADGDTEHPDERIAGLVRSFAEEREWPVPPMGAVPERRRPPSGNAYRSDEGDGDETGDKGPFFDGADTELRLLVRLRGRFGSYDEPVDVEAFADELVASLRAVVGGNAAAIVGLVASFCHEQRFLRQRGAILTRLAAAFEAEPDVAAELYVLAWIGSGEGWDPFGGLDYRDLLERGFALNAAVARARLAAEVGRHVQVNGAMGVTRRITEAMVIAGDPDQAITSWDQAAAVVEHRLPIIAEARPTIAEPGHDLDDHGTKLAYGRLLGSLVHSPDPERRASALGGVAELLQLDPEIAGEAVSSVFSVDAAFTDTLVVVRLLELAASAEQLRDVTPWLSAVAAAPGFGLQQSAGKLLGRLDEELPERVLELPVSRRVVEQSDVAKARFWDTRSRIARLADLWQPFERHVAGRYRDLLDAPGTEAIIKAQVETQFSRSAMWMPLWVLHRWESEQLEIAIHDAAPGLISHLGAVGRWPPGMSDKLNAMLLPDVGAAAARARSRGVRPAGIELPGDRVAAIGSPVLAADDTHQGWTRVALVEEEIQVSDESRSSGTLARVASGLWVGDEPPTDEAPFGTVSMEWRWHDSPPASAEPAPTGPVASYGEEGHLVLFDSLLTLAPNWMTLLDLRPAPLPAPLQLLDARGEVGAVMRCWRMRPYSYDYSPLTPMIRGSELLLRSDLAEAVAESATGTLREVVVVADRELRHGS